MEFIPVISSNIQAVAWENGDLFVRFVNNRVVYRYYNVPKACFLEMLRAPSKGRYLHQRIRGRYQYHRIA